MTSAVPLTLAAYRWWSLYRNLTSLGFGKFIHIASSSSLNWHLAPKCRTFQCNVPTQRVTCNLCRSRCSSALYTSQRKVEAFERLMYSPISRIKACSFSLSIFLYPRTSSSIVQPEPFSFSYLITPNNAFFVHHRLLCTPPRCQRNCYPCSSCNLYSERSRFRCLYRELGIRLGMGSRLYT